MVRAYDQGSHLPFQPQAGSGGVVSLPKTLSFDSPAATNQNIIAE